MTRADLAEEVYQAIGMPLKESDIVVCTIFVLALRSGDKVEIRGFGGFHTERARNFANWLIG
jgi:nucleoid DNA-binding protein